MTLALYNENAYAKSCTAKIISVNAQSVSLDQTIFYPLGGGQLGDTGTLSLDGEIYNVVDTVWGEATQITHILDRPLAQTSISQPVELMIDWERRFKIMMMHSCLHLVCSMFNYPIVGARVGPDKGHLDFFTDGEVIDKQASDVVLNEIINRNLDISIEKVPQDEFNDFMQDRHLIGGMPPVKNGVVRFVRIGEVAAPLDYQPCGGTHVKNTSEIMGMNVATIKSKGKGTRRFAIKYSG